MFGGKFIWQRNIRWTDLRGNRVRRNAIMLRYGIGLAEIVLGEILREGTYFGGKVVPRKGYG